MQLGYLFNLKKEQFKLACQCRLIRIGDFQFLLLCIVYSIVYEYNILFECTCLMLKS